MTTRQRSTSSSTDPPVRREVVLGVDTHGEVHVAAMISPLGKVLGTESFPATTAGYRQLLVWARKRGTVRRAGVEGTGTFGAGLSRYLLAQQVEVYEVNRPDRSARRLLTLSPPDGGGDEDAAAQATHLTLRMLAERIEQLTRQINELNQRLTQLVEHHAPQLLVPMGIGPDSAVTLLITMGDNPERLNTEASFAALCGVSPIEYSSGRRITRRLNHGGDRQANAALHRIVFTRLRHDPRTQAYYERRTQEGKTRREIIRCLKRYAAREVFNLVRPGSRTPAL
ncbi:IS110 family transposase [Streptomyces flaveolus]|uniref:IS110 family transposase n=1 Tax=Streptomyces flaveolus TaxID=67297 RepID=UPI0007C48CFD|nr:IS110 family transposase [Streptomyces flaveolus]